MTLGLGQKGIKRRLILAAMALVLSSSPFAMQTTPTPITTDNSLAGWNGGIDTCNQMNDLSACLKKVGKSDFSERKAWYPVAQLGAGLVLTSQVGQNQSFPIVNPNTDEFYIYTAQKPSQSGVFFEIFLGSEWVFRPKWALQAGVDFDQVYTAYNSNGSLLQGADLQSADLFNYHYNVISRQVMAEAKLLYNYRDQFHPYLLLGLGAAFNSAYNYNTNISPFITFTREYKENMQSAFTYALGLGVDFDITQSIRLGGGYRFTDLGKIQLGQATISNTSVSGSLSQTHLYSNMLLAQVTFIF